MNIFLNQVIKADQTFEYKGNKINTTDLIAWFALAPMREKVYATEPSMTRAIGNSKGFGEPHERLEAYGDGYCVKNRVFGDSFYFVTGDQNAIIRISNDLSDAELISPKTKLASNGDGIEERLSSRLARLYSDDMLKTEEVNEGKTIVDITEPGTYKYSDHFVNSDKETVSISDLIDKLIKHSYIGSTIENIKVDVITATSIAIEKVRELSKEGLQWVVLDTADRSGFILNLVAENENRSYMTLHCYNADETVRITHRTYVTAVERLAMLTYKVNSLGDVILNRPTESDLETEAKPAEATQEITDALNGKNVNLATAGVYEADQQHNGKSIEDSIQLIRMHAHDIHIHHDALDLNNDELTELLLNYLESNPIVDNIQWFNIINNVSGFILVAMDNIHENLLAVIRSKNNGFHFYYSDEMPGEMIKKLVADDYAVNDDFVYNDRLKQYTFVNVDNDIPEGPATETVQQVGVFKDKDTVIALLNDLANAINNAGEDFNSNDLTAIDKQLRRMSEELKDIDARNCELRAYAKRRHDRGIDLSESGLAGFLRPDRNVWEREDGERVIDRPRRERHSRDYRDDRSDRGGRGSRR